MPEGREEKGQPGARQLGAGFLPPPSNSPSLPPRASFLLMPITAPRVMVLPRSQAGMGRARCAEGSTGAAQAPLWLGYQAMS